MVLDQIIIIITQHQVELGLSLAIEFEVERRDKQNILGVGGHFTDRLTDGPIDTQKYLVR